MIFQYTAHFREAWHSLAQANAYFNHVADRLAWIDLDDPAAADFWSGVRPVMGTDNVWETSITILHDEANESVVMTIGYTYYLTFQIRKDAISGEETCLFRHIGTRSKEKDETSPF